MGFFSQSNLNRGTSVNLENYDAITCNNENFTVASMNVIVEGEANYNNIIQAIGIDEFTYFEEHGTEMVYEAGNFSSFIQKVKQFFINIYQKLKGLIAKFIALFDSYTKSDKEFVNKYKKKILLAKTKDFEFKGYEFTNLGISVEKVLDDARSVLKGNADLEGSDRLLKGSVDEIKSLIEQYEDKEEWTEKLRGAAIKSIAGGSESPLDSSEFTKELFSAFRDGEDSKVTLDNIDSSKMISTILGTEEAKKTAKKSFSELEKNIKKSISNLEKLEKTIVNAIPKDKEKGNSEALKATSTMIYFSKELLNIGQAVNGALLTALKDQNRQAKSICVSLMGYKPKNESSVYGYDEDPIYEGSSTLANVVIR